MVTKIVGAAIERFDLGAFLFPARKNNDRQSRAALPYAFDDVETIHVRQTEVEDKEIGGAFVDHVQRTASSPTKSARRCTSPIAWAL
jgi:hypothetical protein